MPIYEYRCPNGHVFELFKRMSDPAPEVCETCGEGPVEQVLYPVAIHYKGSGFYSTDYGRGSGKTKKDSASDGGGSTPSSDAKSSDSSSGTAAAKPAKTADAG